MSHRKRLTKSEIMQIARDYQEYLTGWSVLKDGALARSDGPVVQSVWFDASSSGSYRTTGYVDVLVTPRREGSRNGRGLLRGYLRPPWTTAHRTEHTQRKVEIFEAMRNDLVPRIDEPLNAKELREIRNGMTIATPDEACALAAFSAYYGDAEEALAWSSRFDAAVDATGFPWQDWHRECRQLLDQVAEWLAAGEARARLEPMLQTNKDKWVRAGM